ncbi:MAG: rod shape-determining protein RodA [Deltaproteobacteria bacterium]|nr:rod shape-determining protein RodA [Deltaproteobacteria bacterium]
MIDKKFQSRFYWPLFWTLIGLCAISLVNLHSATYNLTKGGISSFVWSQGLWIGIGLLLGALLLFIDYRLWIRFSYPVYFVTLVLLLLVVFFGKTVGGNRNWLVIGGLNLQPAELAKISLVIAFARFFSDNPPGRSSYQLIELVRPGIMALLPIVLIVLGKDMGSALFFIFLSASLFAFAGIQRKVVLILSVLLLISGVVSYKFVLSPHQKSRIEAFLHPSEDTRGEGYHLLQSKITVGSGRVFGKGYLQGMHSKLLYLPERHTDFIFPVLAEEWGWVGSFFTLFLYATLISFGLQIASKARERFGIFLGLGISAILFWQVVINLGGVLGLIPLTGVTLPILSYGGSSVVTILIGISFLMNISMRRFMF